MRAKDLEVIILDRIAIIQKRYPELIQSRVKVDEEYGLSRSFRRGSNLEAQNRGVADGHVDRNNRWWKVERAGARKPKLRMKEHYIDVLVSLESLFKILADLLRGYGC